MFFLNGAVLASWVPHIPATKARLAIGDGVLGLLLLAMAAAAVVALPLAGWLVGRFGSRPVTAAAALGLSLALPLPVLAPDLGLTGLALALLGGCNATLDVAMNAQGALVERAYRRAIMSSFHGLFSLGGVAGAALASLAMALGVGDVAHVAAAALTAAVVAARAWRDLWPDETARGPRGPAFARPTAALLGLGALAFLGLLAEGAMGDWSAVYLRDTLGASSAVAATGFAGFSLAMAAGRFGGDRLVDRFGPSRVLRASGAVAALGLGSALLVGRPLAGILGFAAVGFGIANVIPILFSAAVRVPGVSGSRALAGVATTGYLGFLAGPPLIGLAAEAAGLGAALGLVCAGCALVSAGARLVPRSGPVDAAVG